MDNKESLEERRNFSRVKIPNLKANFKLLNLRTYSTYLEKNPEPIEDISLGGMSLKTFNNLETKSPVTIDFKIGAEPYTVKVFGRIAWIKQVQEQDYMMGISFSWWNKEEDKKIVKELISQYKKTE
ncbi:MAG: PilZ domain-containing protein [PVC group bacterium]|nr:PilZ domain-containing protein [PVC group bacterium]